MHRALVKRMILWEHGVQRVLALALVVSATAVALSGCIVAPAYVEPAPVYYVAPRPVYVTPAPFVVYGRFGYRRW